MVLQPGTCHQRSSPLPCPLPCLSGHSKPGPCGGTPAPAQGSAAAPVTGLCCGETLRVRVSALVVMETAVRLQRVHAKLSRGRKQLAWEAAVVIDS